jgi:hypothetical protein
MDVTWKKFGGNNPDTTDSFQALASYIFCHQIGIAFQNAPKSYPGLEALPVKASDGLTYGYQAKLFDTQDAKTQRQQLGDTIKAIKPEDVKSLDVLKIYISEAIKGVQDTIDKVWDTKVDSVVKGKKIPIQWFTGINSFQVELEDPYYLQVRSIFFKGGDPSKVHSDNVPTDIIEDLFNRPYYIDLPLNSEKGAISFQDLVDDKNSKVVLIKARAGAGKSILLQRYAYLAAGLDRDPKSRRDIIVANGVYVRFQAHEFVGANPRDVLSRRLESYGFDIQDYPIRLMIDSLDEISERDSRILCQSLRHLVLSSTVRQIISCSREASKNAVSFSQQLEPKIVHIQKLEDDSILSYFNARKDTKKIKILKQAIKDDVDISTLRDIRMLEVAWQVLTNTDDFQKAVLMEKRFDAQAENAKLGELNLLYPQKKKIELILERQGYVLQRGESYDFLISQLQDVIERQNPKLSYFDINQVTDRLKDICIDDVLGAADIMQFEHRSWADYFAAKYLAKRFHDNKNLLVHFAPYEDFLKEWFIPVTRNLYKKEDNLVGSIALGIIETYLGEYMDRSNAEDEFLLRLKISKHHTLLREQIESELVEKAKGNFSPSFALAILNAGFVDIAKNIHEAILEKLNSRDQDTYQAVWDDLPSFYRLQLHFKTQTPDSILERSQRGIYDELRQGRNHRSDQDNLAEKLSAILHMLYDGGLEVDYIIEHSRKSLHYLLFYFFTDPLIARTIHQSEVLRLKILKSFAGNTEDRVAMQGIFGSDFTAKQKKLAKNYLDEMRKENWRRDTHSYHYQVKIYAFKRILGYCEWEEDPYKYDHDEIVTTENIFERLFFFSVITFSHDDLVKFLPWLKDAHTFNRTMSAHYEYPIKFSNTKILSRLLVDLPFSLADKLLATIKDTEHGVVSQYQLTLQVHASAEARFRDLYSFDDVYKQIAYSKDSLEEYVSSISSLGGMLAIFEPEKALSLLYELQRETRLRYGYHKDGLGFFMTDALEIMWDKKLFNYDELQIRTNKIFELISSIRKVSDGSSVGWLPDYFFETLVKFDLKLAEQFYKRYTDEELYDVNVLTIILLARIQRGDDYSDILRGISRHRPHYIERDRVIETYYEHRFIAYMEVVDQENKYTNTDRQNALKRASEEVNSMLKQQEKNWKYHPRAEDDKLAHAIKLYRRYKTEFNLKDAPPYPKPYKSTDLLNNDEYIAKKKKASIDTRQRLKNVNDKVSVSALWESIRSSLDVDYKYLLADKDAVKEFIGKLYKFNVPFKEMEELVSRILYPYSYGSETRLFIAELWRSPYREDFRAFIMRTSHSSDISTLMHIFIGENEVEMTRDLIDEVLDCIKLLTRETKKKNSNTL